MEHALVRRDARMIDEPMRAQSRSLLSGCLLAAVALAGCAIFALVRPQDTLGDDPVVMTKESGALYVRIGDVLHPVLNLASARLIVGTPAKPAVVKESELRHAKRGVLLGIPGAPAVLPEPLPAGESQWAVCDGAAGTSVIAGPLAADTGTTPLGPGRAMLVQARSESTTYLLYDGRRARVSLADVAVTRALKLDTVEPTEVSPAVLNAIPEVPAITAPRIPGSGRRGPAPLGGLPVGSVVRVDRADTDELFVVLDGGVQRAGHVAADIIRFSDSQGARDIVTVAADAIGATPLVERLPLATFPDAARELVVASVVCAHWMPPQQTDVLAGTTATLGAVGLAQADGNGPNVDAVSVPPGRCLYVASTRRYLVADTGVRFDVGGAESAAALGLPAQAPSAPWPILKLLPAGPELGRAGALVAHDGVASHVRGVALPGAPPR